MEGRRGEPAGRGAAVGGVLNVAAGVEPGRGTANGGPEVRRRTGDIATAVGVAAAAEIEVAAGAGIEGAAGADIAVGVEVRTDSVVEGREVESGVEEREVQR